MEKIVREQERRVLTGVPKTTWFRLRKLGQTPAPVRLTPRTIGYLLSDLEEWIRDRKSV